jgi:hypothetical protein
MKAGETSPFFFFGAQIGEQPMSTIFSLGSGTATAESGAATLNNRFGVITTEALTTAQNAIYTLTLTNSAVKAGDIVMVSVQDGTNTQGTPMVGTVEVSDGEVVIKVINKHASAEALNGTLKVSFAAFGA